jgi:hypothetical protein
MTMALPQCNLPSCDEVVTSTSISCPQCADHLTNDLTRTSVHYCSAEHRNLDADHDCERRRLHRDTVRIASLFNSINMEQCRAMLWHRLLASETLDDGSLKLIVDGCQRPITEEPLFEDGVEERVKLASACFANCRRVIQIGSGVLALLIQGELYHIPSILSIIADNY